MSDYSPIGALAAALGLFALSMLGTPVVAIGLASATALAQEELSWPKLAGLTVRKGQRDIYIGRACEHLDLPQNRDCRFHQIVEDDEEGATHALNVFIDADQSSVDIVLYKNTRKRAYLYLTGLDGALRNAALLTRSARGELTWSRTSLNSSEVRKGFVAETAYWRAKQADLERAPDRKN